MEMVERNEKRLRPSMDDLKLKLREIKQPMGTLIVGDPHGDFSLVRAAGAEAETIILLGDQTPNRPIEEELGELTAKTWFVFGNHDSDRQVFLDRHQALMSRHLHCRRLQAGGVWIAGLSGVFRGQVLGPRKDEGLDEILRRRPCLIERRAGWENKRNPSPKPAGTIYQEDLAKLAKMKAHVLVTHEAPESHRYGFRAIGDLARAMGAKLLVHGHHHGRYVSFIDGGIKVVGLGMSGQSDRAGEDIGRAWLEELI